MTTMAQAFELAEEEIRQTWGYGGKTCRYGHLDCSDRERGRCWNEEVDKRAAEILARGTMRHELELHLETLRADLEVEVDLHGSRTEMAATLRRLIVNAEKELEEVKS